MTGDSHTPLYEDIRFLDSLLTETLQTHTGHKTSETVASIVLAVELLQKATGVRSPLRVVPLFETEDDLRQAGNIIR